MPTTPKRPVPAARPAPRPAAAPLSPKGKAPAGQYVHFSDKMTESLMNINRVIEDNKSTLDSIQDMAVELTRAIRSLQAAVMKYVGMADDILATIVPIIEGLPIVPDKVRTSPRMPWHSPRRSPPPANWPTRSCRAWKPA